MIASLYEGTFSVGIDGKFVPIEPDAHPKRGTFKLGIHPFLIHNDTFIALIDAGPGPFGPLNHYTIMTENLKKYDLKPESIQHVYCSHLHIDHIGGLLHKRSDSYIVTFPKAAIWMSGREWDKFVVNAEKKDHLQTVQWARYLESCADLRFIEEESPVPDAIRMITIGGHTEYHQAILYDGEDEKAMMLGDVLARPESINRNFIAKFDYDGKKSQKNRSDYLRKALDEKYVILTYHGDNGAMARLKRFDQNKGYEIEQITSGIIGCKP